MTLKIFRVNSLSLGNEAHATFGSKIIFNLLVAKTVHYCGSCTDSCLRGFPLETTPAFILLVRTQHTDFQCIYLQCRYEYVSHILKRSSENTSNAMILVKKYLNRTFENIKNVTDNSPSEASSPFSDSTCMFCSGSLLQTLENNYREQL